jgi:hypothetical protein
MALLKKRLSKRKFISDHQIMQFTSLAEFNAILQQFNVVTDRGAGNTLMREKGGLIYSLISENGEQMGIPIKASAIYNKPTLASLQA